MQKKEACLDYKGAGKASTRFGFGLVLVFFVLFLVMVMVILDTIWIIETEVGKGGGGGLYISWRGFKTEQRLTLTDLRECVCM